MGLLGRKDIGETFLVGRSLDPKFQVGLGAGMGVLVLVALAFESVVLNNTGLHEWGWRILFAGLLVACVLAASTSLALLRRGMAELSGPSFGSCRHLQLERLLLGSAATGRTEKNAERQLLEAIDRHGEITPTRAALETSLTVAEVDRMLSDLAKGGYLQVRVEGGKLLYGL